MPRSLPSPFIRPILRLRQSAHGGAFTKRQQFYPESYRAAERGWFRGYQLRLEPGAMTPSGHWIQIDGGILIGGDFTMSTTGLP